MHSIIINSFMKVVLVCYILLLTNIKLPKWSRILGEFFKTSLIKNGLYVELYLSRKILKTYKSTNQKFPGERITALKLHLPLILDVHTLTLNWRLYMRLLHTDTCHESPSCWCTDWDNREVEISTFTGKCTREIT